MTSDVRPVDADRTIVTTRVFDAPRQLVFKAWTEPEQVVRWWGPNGFTTTIHEMDVRPGGVWRFIMHGPDGVDYPNRVDYLEVVEPERLVYDHGDDDETTGVLFRATVTFAEQEGKTTVSLQTVFKSAAERERAVREVGAIEGANQTLARLAEHLSSIIDR